MTAGRSGATGRPGSGGTGPPVRRVADWDAARLRDLAAEYGTPLYVLDADRVRENYRRIAGALPDAEVLYAVKANASPAALSALAAAGAGAETASPPELRRALAAGFDPGRTHYTAVNPPGPELDELVELAAEHPALTVTAGARDTLDRLAERGFSGRLALRVNPDAGAGHHDDVVTGVDRQFGIPVEEAPDVLRSAADRFEVVGLHAHVGSGILDGDLAGYRAAVERVGSLAAATEAGTGDAPALDLEFVDFGGGFGVPYRPDEDPLDLDRVRGILRGATADLRADPVVEPGRYLVADAGVLLTRVNTVRPGDEGEGPVPTVAGVDAGLHTLLRPALFDAHHPVRNVAAGARSRERASTTVVGPVCSGADTLCTGRKLRRVERGDLLAVGNAGAYGRELASRFHTRALPTEVALAGGEARVARAGDPAPDPGGSR